MTGAVGRCCDDRAMRRPATLAALVIATAIALSPPVSADPTADPGDVGFAPLGRTDTAGKSANVHVTAWMTP